MFIGLMGVASDGTLYTPSGNKICKVPQWAVWRIQRAFQCGSLKHMENPFTLTT